MHKLYDILCRWTHATDEEVAYVKTLLMPEDAIDKITFKVTEHPDINSKGEMYIAWFDIDVYSNGLPLGYIIINTESGTVDYRLNLV